MRFTTTARLLSVLLLLASVGCKTGSPATAGGAAYFCGALCASVVVNVGATSSSSAGLRFSIQSLTGDFPALAFFASLPGTSLEALTYDETNASAATTIVREAATGGTVWTQTSGASGTLGSFSLTILDAGEAVATDAGTEWPSPTGSLTGTLVPVGTLTDAGLLIGVSFPTPAGLACQPDGGVCNSGVPSEP